jgi:hypothetical protein
VVKKLLPEWPNRKTIPPPTILVGCHIFGQVANERIVFLQVACQAKMAGGEL